MGAYNNQFKRAADGRHPTQNGHRSQSSATDYVRGNSLFSRIDILTILSVHYLLGGAKTMLKILVAIILSVPFVISASGEELDKWEAADRETVRLPPSDFPHLPKSVRDDLDARGCTIPQVYCRNCKPHNVISGHFKHPSQVDWTVLCSIDRQSTLLVYWAVRLSPFRSYQPQPTSAGCRVWVATSSDSATVSIPLTRSILRTTPTGTAASCPRTSTTKVLTRRLLRKHLVFITGMRGSGLSYGEQINCEHHLTRDIPNQVELTTSAFGKSRRSDFGF